MFLCFKSYLCMYTLKQKYIHNALNIQEVFLHSLFFIFIQFDY